MNKFLKKLSVLLVVTTMALSAIGCGAKEAVATDAAPSTEAVSTEAPVEASSEAVTTETATTEVATASEEDYKAKVEEVYGNISTTSAEIMAAVDQTDMEKTVEAMKTLVATVKPMYEELASLTAPESLKEAQAQIKTGAEASVELLNISLEMFALEDASDEEAETKVAELQGKMATFQASAQELVTGINTVLGNTVAE